MTGVRFSGLLNTLLYDLKHVDGVTKLAIGGRDGFLIGEYQDNEFETLTLMSAAMFKAAETVTTKFEKNCPKRLTVDYEGGKLIATTAGTKALIALMAGKDANIEKINSELERAAEKIKEIF